MTCKEIERLLADYSADNLSKRMMRRIESHLQSCAECAQKEEQLQEVMALVVSKMETTEPPAGLWNGVSNQIAAQNAIGERALRQSPWRRIALGFSVAAAAVVVLFSGLSSRQPPASVSERQMNAETATYFQNHLAAASRDAFADRVSLGFVSVFESENQE